MSLGIRSRLFLVSLALIVVATLSSSIYLENQVRSLLDRRIENDLERLASTVREVLTLERGLTDAGRLDALADRLGVAARARVTLIGEGGRVLGDSDVEVEELSSLENHDHRPEVIAARRDGMGTHRRTSATVGVESLYLAVPCEIAGRPGIARVSVPLSEVDEIIWRLRTFVLLAGMIGVAVAAFMSGLASHLVSRTFRDLVDRARALAQGERGRINILSKDEIGLLAGSLNRISDDLEFAMRTLADERDRFQTVLEGMGDAVVTVDSEHRVTLANQTAMGYLGLHVSPAGQPVSDVIRSGAVAERLATTDAEESATFEFDLAGNRPRRLLTRITPLRGGGGKVIVMHDVTEIRRLETVRRDFVANVSHELRTPVSVILANSETLIDGALEDRAQAGRFLEAIHANAGRLSQLIGDLLDLSAIEAGRYRLELRPVAVADLLEDISRAVARPMRDKDQTFELDCADDLRVLADPKALEQVLVNLLDNAAKYTPVGGRITVSGIRTTHGIRIAVADDGPGIEPAHRERIFERFYRVDPGRSRELGGTGLGLAIVRHLAESMGGKVGVEAVAPHGSRFWIDLADAG